MVTVLMLNLKASEVVTVGTEATVVTRVGRDLAAVLAGERLIDPGEAVAHDSQ